MTTDMTNKPFRSVLNTSGVLGKGLAANIKSFKLHEEDFIDASRPNAPEHMRDAHRAAEIITGRTYEVSHPLLRKVGVSSPADATGTLRLLKTEAMTRGAREAIRQNPLAHIGTYKRADAMRASLRDLIVTLEKGAAEMDAFIAEEFPLVTPELLAEVAAEEARVAAERKREGLELRAREQAAREALDAEAARQRAAVVKAERDKEARVKAILAELEAEAGVTPRG
jgi:hypothetical protein